MNKIKCLILESDTDFINSVKDYYLKPIPKFLDDSIIILEPEKFPDGEFFVRIPQNIRDSHCYLYASLTPENIFDVIITIDTIKRASASKITLVTPYLPYSRQDRRVDTRTPVSAKVLANMLEKAGIDHLITMDVHALQIEGFYNVPFDNLQGSKHLITNLIENLHFKNLVLVAPDAGAAKRVRHLAEHFSFDVAILDKKRISPTEVKSYLIGDVKGRDCLLIDDLVSTGNTLIEGSKVLKKEGANEISAAAIHMLGDTEKMSKHFKTFSFYDTLGKRDLRKQLNVYKFSSSFHLVSAVSLDSIGKSVSKMFWG